MHVPFFEISSTAAKLRPALAQAFTSLGATPLVGGPTVRLLEEAVGAYTGARHCLAVGSGTDALAVMLRAAGVGPGDEVIVPSYTFFASASTVVHVGAVPVFVDITPGSYAIDPARVREAITPRTKAIMPVHLFTSMAPMAQLAELADRHGLLLLEDSAEAIGMRTGGRHAGLFGAAGVLSFFPTKTLGAFGDAGMILTDDDALAERARGLAEGSAGGGAWRSGCDDIAATVLLHRLASLPDEIAARAEAAARYNARLTGIPGLTIPQPPDPNPIWYVYLVEAERRDELAAALARDGIETEIYYPRPLPAQPCFDDLNSRSHPVPVAERASRCALALPLYPDLGTDRIDHVSDCVARFYGDRHA
jgi:dTDP-4-amino-4,6-dideoxygalactose transaminase